MSTSTKVKRRTRPGFVHPYPGPEYRAYTYAFMVKNGIVERTATSHSKVVA